MTCRWLHEIFLIVSTQTAKFVGMALFADFQQQDLKICGAKVFLLKQCINKAEPVGLYSKGVDANYPTCTSKPRGGRKKIGKMFLC